MSAHRPHLFHCRGTIAARLALMAIGLSACSSSGSSPAAANKAAVKEVARVTQNGSGYQTSLRARAGDTVEFLTDVRQHGKNALPVSVRILQGSSGRITLTATAAGHTSTATILNPGHAPIYLTAMHYPCVLPPAQTFCPLVGSSNSSTGYQLQFRVRGSVPILIAGRLASRLTGAVRKPRRATSAAVPPYKLTEAILVRSPSRASTRGLRPSAAVTAASGDTLILETHVASPISGAPQPVTINFSRGPASSITVTAHVRGSRPARATIHGAGGSSVRIAAAHFSCYLPPYPTFCPLTASDTTARRYQLTFQATPILSPIRIIAKIG